MHGSAAYFAQVLNNITGPRASHGIRRSLAVTMLAVALAALGCGTAETSQRALGEPPQVRRPRHP